ncbi:MAG: TfoX/Sxy family protein [Candidatus Dojkabacteria bacterium]
MAYDMELADRVRKALAGRQGLAEKSLFGGLTFTINDNMVVSVSNQGLVGRVGPKMQEEALKMPNVKQRMLGPKAMNGMIVVEPAGYANDEDLNKVVNWIADIIAALPPKEKK